MLRLLSGIQPTGQMHLGNYFGAVKNWVHMQEEYESFFMIADLHALTTTYDAPQHLKQCKHNLLIDLLSVGVNPEKAHIFYQSDIFEHSELYVLLSMITPISWLKRVPTYKDKLSESSNIDSQNYGLLGYPVLQAADIMLYQTDVVPVGKDQLPHLELTREIVRRFNLLYKTSFPLPNEVLTEFSVLPGLDGRKMSKSYGNTLPLSSSKEDIDSKILKMVTDPNRVRLSDPGNPDVCPVFKYHILFTSSEKTQTISEECKSAKIGCVACKKQCAKSINDILSPVRERHALFKDKTKLLDTILLEGTSHAKKRARESMEKIRSAIGL
jgi:tryptophanyl-tRNA synthetase